MEINININKSDILERVGVMSANIGSKLRAETADGNVVSRYNDIATITENEEVLSDFFSEGCNNILLHGSTFIKEAEPVDDVLNITFKFPLNTDEAVIKVGLEHLIKDYLSEYVLDKWLNKICNVEYASITETLLMSYIDFMHARIYQITTNNIGDNYLGNEMPQGYEPMKMVRYKHSNDNR